MEKPFEIRQDELTQTIAQAMQESRLPAGALALIVEKILGNLRQEAHRAVMQYRQEAGEEVTPAKPNKAKE